MALGRVSRACAWWAGHTWGCLPRLDAEAVNEISATGAGRNRRRVPAPVSPVAGRRSHIFAGSRAGLRRHRATLMGVAWWAWLDGRGSMGVACWVSLDETKRSATPRWESPVGHPSARPLHRAPGLSSSRGLRRNHRRRGHSCTASFGSVAPLR